MDRDTSSELVVEFTDTHLVISIGKDNLIFGAIRGSYFDNIWNEKVCNPNTINPLMYDLVIKDPEEFFKAILYQLTTENEAGDTLIYEMFDKAAENAYEQGEFSFIDD